MGKRQGRPRLDAASGPARRRVTLRVTDAQQLELRRIADETGRRVSTVLREAVDEWVGDYRERRVFRQPK
jgi:hypothetical protein